MRFSSDGRYVAIGYSDGVSQIYDTIKGVTIWYAGSDQGSINSVCLSHDGAYLATAGQDKLIRVSHWLSDILSALTITSHLDADSHHYPSSFRSISHLSAQYNTLVRSPGPARAH